MSVLHTLLDEGAAHDRFYRNGYSNHLPMALTALHALGASDARLKAVARLHAGDLQPAPPPVAWLAGEPWPDHLGQASAYSAYRNLFRHWLLHERPEVVLPQVLPQLMAGCAASAFHALLRTAYGVMAQHLGELADGLACWAAHHQPLGALPEARSTVTDVELLLRQLPALDSQAPSIARRISQAAEHGIVHRVAARLQVGERTLPQLARLAAYAYAGSGNFTVLHLLTSAHAMRVLLPYLDDADAERQALRHYWHAYATTVVAAAIEHQPEPVLQSWETLVETAVASDDEHVIKLVHSCREESKVYGGVAWQFAASRVLASPSAAG